MSVAESLTPVEDQAHAVNRAYLAARAFATPLYHARREVEPNPEMKAISIAIFELGVNAAYAWYTLLEREVAEPERALREANRLAEDSRQRQRQLEAKVREEWRRYRPGAGRYHGGGEALVKSRRDTFRMHRRYVPLVLGGKRTRGRA